MKGTLLVNTITVIQGSLLANKLEVRSTTLRIHVELDFRSQQHFLWLSEAQSCKLEFERFSVWLKIQDGAECGKHLRHLRDTF